VVELKMYLMAVPLFNELTPPTFTTNPLSIF
jgi:hypothetical protein